MKRYAVIVAGGQGVRMGADRPKQFLEIGGKPILRHTVERFLDFDPSMEIILVLPSAGKAWWRDYCRTEGFLERYSMVSGGITRFHSVQNALRFVGDEGIVAVHDGVRPMIGRELLARLFEAAAVSPAVVPAVPRDGLVLVQTPQLFDAKILKEAYRQPFSPDFTDDASVVEAAGTPVRIIPGERLNIKITTPDDLALAGKLLRLSSC